VLAALVAAALAVPGGAPAAVVAPDTQIDSGPADGATVTAADVTFTYSGIPAIGIDHFECAIDGGPRAACPAAGRTFNGLTLGVHTFEVVAVNAFAQADPTPATRTWMVAAPDRAVPGPTSTAAPLAPLPPEIVTTQSASGALDPPPVSHPTRTRALTLRGTAADAAPGRVTKVRVSVALTTGFACRFLRADGTFSAPRDCRRTTYVTATGTTAWLLRLPELVPGRYLIWTRAIDNAGNVERKNAARNLLRVRVS
jgi:hypothetical protein